MITKFDEIIHITGEIKIKDNDCAKISFSLIKDLCFHLEEKFNLPNLDLEIKFQPAKLSYKIKLSVINEIELKKYLLSYGLILLKKEPLNLLFEGEALVDFKQSLDLSFLEFKLLKKKFVDNNLDSEEISEIHSNFGQTLI